MTEREATKMFHYYTYFVMTIEDELSVIENKSSLQYRVKQAALHRAKLELKNASDRLINYVRGSI